MHIRWPYGTDPTGQGFFCPVMEQKRRDYFTLKVLRPAEAESVYQCRPGSRIGSIFLAEDMRYFQPPPGLDLGVRSPDVRAWISMKGGIIAQGWDTAMSASQSANWTVGVTGMLVPCEEFHREQDQVLGVCDPHYDVYLLDLYRAKLDIGDLALNMRQFSVKWNPEKVLVEKRAHGAAAMQSLANTGIPLEGVATHESKRERAINGGSGAGSVQGWYRSGRVLHPYGAPWLGDLERELKDFTGEVGGTDDQVDAVVHLINWAIVEGSISVQFPAGWQTPEEADRQMHQDVGNSLHSWQRWQSPAEKLIEQGVILDPFADMCGRCKHFDAKRRPSCGVHKWNVVALNPACESYDDGNAMSTFPRF